MADGHAHAEPLPHGPGEHVADVHVHHRKLQHHFDNMAQQAEASTLGMWVFLVTEIMFFGGLFMCYLVYRTAQPAGFEEASHHINLILGATNTVVLICSSLTMALAVHAAQTNSDRRVQVTLLLTTMFFGLVFLGVKAYEYYEKFRDHHVPGAYFQWDGHYPAAAEMFFSLYFAMTGLHALHMVVGIGIMTVISYMAWKRTFDATYYTPLEVAGLYWHFVDIVWIFLFPLLYLIGGHYR